jgi:hypothetical protein
MLFAELEDNFVKKFADNVLRKDIPRVHPQLTTLQANIVQPVYGYAGIAVNMLRQRNCLLVP